MDRDDSLAKNGQCLDTVRALHQTVVSLRQALEQSRSEVIELKSKVWPLDSVEEVLRNLSIENHVLRQKIIGYQERASKEEFISTEEDKDINFDLPKEDSLELKHKDNIPQKHVTIVTPRTEELLQDHDYKEQIKSSELLSLSTVKKDPFSSAQNIAKNFTTSIPTKKEGNVNQTLSQKCLLKPVSTLEVTARNSSESQQENVTHEVKTHSSPKAIHEETKTLKKQPKKLRPVLKTAEFKNNDTSTSEFFKLREQNQTVLSDQRQSKNPRQALELKKTHLNSREQEKEFRQTKEHKQEDEQIQTRRHEQLPEKQRQQLESKKKRKQGISTKSTEQAEIIKEDRARKLPKQKEQRQLREERLVEQPKKKLQQEPQDLLKKSKQNKHPCRVQIPQRQKHIEEVKKEVEEQTTYTENFKTTTTASNKTYRTEKLSEFQRSEREIKKTEENYKDSSEQINNNDVLVPKIKEKNKKRIVDLKIDVTVFKPSNEKKLSISIPQELLYNTDKSDSIEEQLKKKIADSERKTLKTEEGTTDFKKQIIETEQIKEQTSESDKERSELDLETSEVHETICKVESEPDKRVIKKASESDLEISEAGERVGDTDKETSESVQSFNHSTLEKNEFEDIIDDTDDDVDQCSLYSNGELTQQSGEELDLEFSEPEVVEKFKFKKTKELPEKSVTEVPENESEQDLPEVVVPALDIQSSPHGSEAYEETKIVVTTENLSPRKISKSLENIVLKSQKKNPKTPHRLSFSKTLSYSNICELNSDSKFVYSFEEFVKMSDETGKTNSLKQSNENLIIEHQNGALSERRENLRVVGSMQESQELETEPEVDEVELIFTTDETKEEDFKEELVSIEMNTDGPQLLQCPTSEFEQNLSHASNLSTELEDDVFNDNFENENQENSNFQSQTFDFQRENSQLYNSKSDNSINHEEKSLKSYYSYQDSSFENKSMEKDESFDRFDDRVRIIETDISKVGIHDVEYSLGRRNTCPNPLQYRPILHREALGKSGFGARKSRPILAHSSAARKDSGAQTDISALPGSSWRSESNLIHKVKVGDNFTTLPSKFPMPGNRLRLSEKTVEARRVLLSDIGFTSMVPELSRSADHLCPPNFKPAVPTSTATFGQFLRAPDLYSPGFQSQRFMWNTTTTPSEGSHTHSRYSSLYPLTSPPVPTRRCSAPVSPSRRAALKQTPSKVRFANGSLPELRSDWTSTIDSGDSTDSLVEEAEHYLRRSIDCIASGRDVTYRCDSSKGGLRRASAPEPSRDNVPPQGWQPFLPRLPRDLRLDHWVKVISPEGRVRGGRVRYVGPLLSQTEQFVGVQLSTPDGHSDGTFNNRRYFQCEPYHGIFVPFKKVVMGWRP